MKFQRKMVDVLIQRMNEPCSYIQIVNGPRQCGKTTALKQALQEIKIPYHYVSADEATSNRVEWLKSQWSFARSQINENSQSAILVVDEVQSIAQWSTVVKSLYDEDKWAERDLRVFLSGSSSLLLQHGLNESLMGRFEVIPFTHWSFSEMQEAFDYTLQEFLYFGGYPGAAVFKNNEKRWLDYMQNSVITPSIAKDVVAMQDVRKPALMQRLFMLGCEYSAQELSFRKMLGQLDDAGNTATLSHYLELLNNASLLCGLQKYDKKMLNTRASSPRFCVYDTSFMIVASGQDRHSLLTEPSKFGHLCEAAIGAYLLARARQDGFNVFWWRDGNFEVDFVLQDGERITAIEVKSSRPKNADGLAKFMSKFSNAKPLVVGSDYTGCLLEDFLLGNIDLF